MRPTTRKSPPPSAYEHMESRALNNLPASVQQPELSVSGGNYDEASQRMAFTVTLSAASSWTVSFDYSTLGGTASAGADFVAAAGQLSFAPGQTELEVWIQLLDDTSVEAVETVTLQLSKPTGAVIVAGEASGTIVSDDVPSLSVSGSSYDEQTKQMEFLVTMSDASPFPVSLSYSTLDGTALAGSDYTASTGTLTFPPGQTELKIQVAITDDTEVEPDETVMMELSSPIGATIATSAASGTIVSDDVASTPTSTAPFVFDPAASGSWDSSMSGRAGVADVFVIDMSNGTDGPGFFEDGDVLVGFDLALDTLLLTNYNEILWIDSWSIDNLEFWTTITIENPVNFQPEEFWSRQVLYFDTGFWATNSLSDLHVVWDPTGAKLKDMLIAENISPV